MTSFAAEIEHLDPDTLKIRVRHDGVLSTRAEIHRLWAVDDSFGSAFSKTLADAPFDAFFWETPPLTPERFEAPFECVVKAAPSLARMRADRRAFAPQLDKASDRDVATFMNLGGDAELIVPHDLGSGAGYAHLASFLRSAPPRQIAELWRRVAIAADPWLANGRPFWISTSGLGVAWLHVRLDQRPKYYSHAPYRGV